MDFTYYLPEIIFAVILAVALIWGVCFIREMILHSKGKAACVYCRHVTSKISPKKYLFLLPVSFGTKYADAKHYLPTHLRPIMGTDQIPTGKRACWVERYSCNRCGREQVMVTDFLLVRGTEDVKGTYVLPYEPFQKLIERWESMAVTGIHVL